MRETQPEEDIVPPTEGSEQATAALSTQAGEAQDESLDAELQDDFDGIDWDRLKKYIKPLATQRAKKSWVYRHGYRVALKRDPTRIFFVCRYCHKNYIPGGIYETTKSTSSAGQHCMGNARGHGLTPTGKAAPKPYSTLQRLLFTNQLSQSAANELSGFNIQRFRLAAVEWLVENNHPLSEFEKPAFRRMIEAANPSAEAAVWASHHSVARYIMRLYDYTRPRVVNDLSDALSKIHISFDGWTTKGGKRGFLGIVAHYVNKHGNLIDLPIALPQLAGSHSGKAMAGVILQTLQQFNIDERAIGYFVLDNASNNDTAIEEIAKKLRFNAGHRRLRCGPHTINLIGQALLWGRNTSAYNNDASEIPDEDNFMRSWRREGPIGVLLDIIGYIKTPQQYAQFARFQQLAHLELPADAPADARKILEPIKPVVTRWNSYYECFERAVKLQSAVNAYASSHITRVRDEDFFAISRNNKLSNAPAWMRTNGLTAHDWAVITEYMDALKPLKMATKRLEGRGKKGGFGAIAEIIPVFEYLFNYYEDRVKIYEAVNYNEHDEAPEDHFVINLKAAWAKANDYYEKLDDTPIYYTATLLHPYYSTYCEQVWADKPDWLEANNSAFRALWAEYNTPIVRPRRPQPSVRLYDMDDAIDSILAPVNPEDETEDEYDRWKRCEPRCGKDSEYAQEPIKYWMSLRDRYPNLSRLALDVLSIPASSCECERMFSELGDLLEPRRRNISPQLLAAIQCVRRWIRAGFSRDDEVNNTGNLTDDEIDARYRLAEWVGGDEV